ncbi:molybdopterin dinucleotide binding domain-containing protein [Cryobacterium sp. CAN_C3]|uniref:molybdopterin dinucleotide binding domain-containing protein n=1 Tax=unclassified Cryobacterium TaxID=2649013 RepID=UPI0018C97E9F
MSTNIRFDTVFLPFHFAGDQGANLLTDDEIDPINIMPELKTTTVRVSARVEADAHV